MSARTLFTASLKDAGEDLRIITPNQRLALFLSRDWAREQAKTRQQWTPLQVVPWEQWLGRLWQDWSLTEGALGEKVPRLLLPEEVRSCWGAIAGVQHAEQAMEADQLARRWQMPLDAAYCNEHQRTALQWREQYAALKRHHGWCDAIDILEIFTNTLAHTAKQDSTGVDLKTPAHHSSHSSNTNIPSVRFASFIEACCGQPLLFYGFVEFSPLQQAWLNRLEACDVACKFDHQLLPSAIAPEVVEAQDPNEELYAAAQWAKTTWSRLARDAVFNRDDLFDGPRIAIVVPDLAQQQAQVKAVMSEVFQWQELLNTEVHWTISAGMAFADYPLIRCLLDCLDLCFSAIELPALERLLQSRFWGNGCFQVDGACFESLRRSGREVWTLAQFRSFYLWHGVRQQPQRKQEEVLERLDQIQQFGQTHGSERASWRQWLGYFQQAIDCIAWPGPEKLSSDDFQLLHRWYRWWLGQLQEADARIPLTQQQARSKLSKAWRELMFQPEAKTDRILVLGILEAAALPLDAVYIVGLTAAHWPAASQPNPFLPYEEQRTYQLPRASTQREVWYSQALLRWYTCSACAVTLSYARTHEDVPQFISPLVEASFGPLQVGSASHTPWRHRLTLDWSAPLDQLSPFAGTRLGRTNFGLSEQANCPFRGGVALRLAPSEFVLPKTSVSGMDRGNWLHQVLEHVYQGAQSREALLKVSVQDIESAVKQVIERAASSLALLTPLTQGVERQRLTELVQSGIELETQRANFTVKGIEEKVLLHWRGFEMSLRLDRWDSVESKLVLIDYKSSVPAISDQRLVAPQLVLYALSLAQKLDISVEDLEPLLAQAVYFVFNSKSGTQWRDLIDASSGEQISWLQQQIGLLGIVLDEVRQGEASLKPLNLEKTCLECHYQSYCRIRSRREGLA